MKSREVFWCDLWTNQLTPSKSKSPNVNKRNGN